MLSKNTVCLSALRTAKNAVFDACLKAGNEDRKAPSDALVLNTIRKQIKQRQDTAEVYRTAAVQNERTIELLKTEEAEIAELNKFLPAPIPEEQVDQIIETTIGLINYPVTLKDMNRIIKEVNILTNNAVVPQELAAKVKANITARNERLKSTQAAN